MPKEYFRCLIFMVLIATSAFAQDNETQSVQTILFKVTHPETDATSYLFGTHHAFGQSFFDSLANVYQALSECDILIKENLNIPGHLPEDIINHRTVTTKWSKFLQQEDLQFVTNLFASSPTNFNKMTPTELYVFLYRYFNQRVCLDKGPSDSSLTLDNYIGTKAKALGLELIGLETAEEQFYIINKDVEGMPSKVHKRRLSQIIDQIKLDQKGDCAETDWFREMDFDLQLNEPCQNTLTLTDRNEKWMNIISGYIEERNCFIAVGLSHLMYNCGLLVEIEELGFTVTPVPAK